MTLERLSCWRELIPVPSHGSTYVLYMIPPQNVMPARVTPVVVPENFTPVRNLATVSCTRASSETQGQSVGSGEKVGRKFSSTGERAPGYRLSPNYFQKFKQMPAPDWAQKMLCIIVPNRRTVSPEFFSWVRTRRLLSRSRLVWLMHQRNARSQETFSLI